MGLLGALSLVGLLVIVGAALGLIWFGEFAGALPPAADLASRQMFQTMPVFARDGSTTLYEITDPQGGRRTVVPLSSVSRFVVEATIATEDAGFFSNPGFELRSILRAGFDDLTHKQIVSGASTITQQVVRNVLLDSTDRSDVSARRKIKEIVVAYQVFRTYSKDDILDIYLNEINYGNRNYGIEAAAEGYFGVSAANLNVAQAALLAGIPQAPSFYNPYLRMADVKDRQSYVLQRMVEQGYISEAEASAAAAEDVQLVDGHRPVVAPHFVTYVTDDLARTLGSDRLYQAGDQVITSLDPRIQAIFDQSVQANLKALQQANGDNVAAVALDPRTGEILALVGSANFDDSTIAGEVNMALAPRQSGGILTPATFALGLGRGLTLVSPIVNPYDASANSNSTGSIASASGQGRVLPPTVREALTRGLERPASAVMRLAGSQGFIDLADAIGLNGLAKRLDYGPDMIVAGAHVAPLEVAQVYAMFAAGGVARSPIAITRILNRGYQVIQDTTSPDRPVLESGIAYLITSVLADSPVTTTDGRPVLEPGPRIASHSALSQDGRDGWVAGYVPNLVVVVWVGGGNRALRDLDPALRMWGDMFGNALKLHPSDDFPIPQDVTTVSLCKNAACSERQNEVVLRGTEAIVRAANAVAVAQPARAIANSRTPLVNRDQMSVTALANPSDTSAATKPDIRRGPISIPNVAGASPEQGRERLVAAGLTVAAVPKYLAAAQLPPGARNIATGQIVSTTPSAGAVVLPGAEVTLVIRRN